MSIIKLTERGKQLRRDTIELSAANGGYHYGGCFSAIEILDTIFNEMSPIHDKFILSKGHACWPYYVLLREQGFTPKLQGHPSRDPCNKVHATTGSLGHGFPIAVGMTLAKKIKCREGKIYVLMGDGECQEGTTWESMLIAAQLKLDNLCVIVDWNRIQGSGFVEAVTAMPSIARIANMLGWESYEVDGHNIGDIINAVCKKQNSPKMLMAHTVKGAGVSFMENKPEWHACWLDPEHKAKALEELK